MIVFFVSLRLSVAGKVLGVPGTRSVFSGTLGMHGPQMIWRGPSSMKPCCSLSSISLIQGLRVDLLSTHLTSCQHPNTISMFGLAACCQMCREEVYPRTLI